MTIDIYNAVGYRLMKYTVLPTLLALLGSDLRAEWLREMKARKLSDLEELSRLETRKAATNISLRKIQ
jgi:hypothetical protein